ncbi:5380_t:CDS:2 [Cetraspora pellucida]|uniref:5380_t:CDS:1 n=1 Tax=Cetraspora pellucida TaxID=1433469 RepID=A0A9N9K3S9_9GLOM|nr:5380_t:CDS:2 [Cetraspora pellucida]
MLHLSQKKKQAPVNEKMLSELSQLETYNELLPKLSLAMCNSKHISESLGWYTDVPISVKDKDDKIVMSTGNFAHINNSKLKPMLCLDMI